MELTLIQKIVVWAPPVLLAITLHEVAHGWVARLFGDDTAYVMGRLTLNPLRHVDPIGTVVLPAVLVLLGSPFIFGWAKPVPVAFGNLRNPKRDMVYVALAGPLANLAMALIWTLVTAFAIGMLPGMTYIAEPLMFMGAAGVLINVVLMVLNLVPIPPLDGGRVAVGLLPHPASRWVSYVEPIGLPILVALLFTGILGLIIGGPIFFISDKLMGLAGMDLRVLLQFLS
ncbi:MAG TPA: site-2 protease family protein [Gammaproteobacteria bacterium]|nr:site-2 protease family protein [Gammaproteobacteria bacterium]